MQETEAPPSWCATISRRWEDWSSIVQSCWCHWHGGSRWIPTSSTCWTGQTLVSHTPSCLWMMCEHRHSLGSTMVHTLRKQYRSLVESGHIGWLNNGGTRQQYLRITTIVLAWVQANLHLNWIIRGWNNFSGQITGNHHTDKLKLSICLQTLPWSISGSLVVVVIRWEKALDRSKDGVWRAVPKCMDKSQCFDLKPFSIGIEHQKRLVREDLPWNVLFKLLD